MSMQRRLLACLPAVLAGAVLCAGAAPAPGLVSGISVLPDKAPDCSSLAAIAESVTRSCTTNDEKAVAIYNFMQLTHYHRAYPSEPGGLPALKEIHCYGWCLCGGLHAVQSALWRQLGWDWRFVGWDGHTTVEARYDDRWHYLDVFLKYYAWMPAAGAPGGRTIAGQDDLAADPDGLVRNVLVRDPERNCVYAADNRFGWYGNRFNAGGVALLSCGDGIEDVIRGLGTHRPGNADEGWGGIVHADRDYSAAVDLAPGFRLTNTWDPVPDAWHWQDDATPPGHTCGGHKDTRNDPGIGLILEPYVSAKPGRSYGSGILEFEADFGGADGLSAFAEVRNAHLTDGALHPAQAGEPGSVVVDLSSPYILTRASGEAVGADRTEVSVDGGNTFIAVDPADFGAAVKGHNRALVRVSFRNPLTRLALRAIVQNNPGALPYLSPGRNTVTVSAHAPGASEATRLVVTYAYRLGSRGKSFEELYDEGKEIAKGHNAAWDDTVTFVRREFAPGELPATFTIDCPTPEGRYPVYPRMVFLRREVLGPRGEPTPLPAPPVTPVAGPGETLASLPSPWAAGATRPPPAPPRPTRRVAIPAAGLSHVSMGGEVFENRFVKWLKDDSDAWVLLVQFDPAALPPRDEVASAKLVFRVEEAHDKAPMLAAAVLLEAPFEPGKPYDFRHLGRTVGTTVVAQGTGERFVPSRRYEIDVAPALRTWSRGTPAHGLALRIVPSRGIDDGWTVRFTPDRENPPILELETYAGGE